MKFWLMMTVAVALEVGLWAAIFWADRYLKRKRMALALDHPVSWAVAKTAVTFPRRTRRTIIRVLNTPGWPTMTLAPEEHAAMTAFWAKIRLTEAITPEALAREWPEHFS